MIALRFEPAFRQFYLFDEERCPPYPEDIARSDIALGIKAVPYLLAIYTRTEDELELSVTVGGASAAAEDWERVVEASLEVPSGVLLVTTPETFLPDAQRIHIDPGTYRVSIASRHSDGDRPEQYAIHLTRSASVEEVAVVRGSHAA